MNRNGTLAIVIALGLAATGVAFLVLRGEKHGEAARDRAEIAGSAAEAVEKPAMTASRAESPPRLPTPGRGAAIVPKPAFDADSIRVRVIDHLGRPLPECPVGLIALKDGKARLVTSTTSAADGVARLSDLEQCSPYAGGGATFAAALGVLAEDEVSAPVDPAAPPPEPITLQAPALGALRIEFRLCDEPLAEEEATKVTLRVASKAEGDESWIPLRVTGGTARFPWVATGTPVVATGHPRRFAPAKGKADVPTEPGGEATLTIPFIATPRLLLGRALDESGAPLAGRAISVIVRPAEHNRFSLDAMTDGAGLFEAKVGVHLDEPFRIEVAVRSPGSIDAVSEAREMPRSCVERLACGDFVLKESPILVSGRVVDEAEAPIAGAEVIVRYARNVGPDHYSYDETIPDHHRFVTGADGAFLVRGPHKTPEISVQPKREGYPLARFDERIPAGSRDITVVLGSPGEPESQPVDPRPAVGDLELTVVDADSHLIAAVGLRTPPIPGRKEAERIFAAEGKARIVMHESPLQVEISAEGFRTELISATPGERTVTLKAGLEIAVLLARRPTLPEGVRLGLRVELKRAAIPLLETHWYDGTRKLEAFDADGRLRQRVSAPGEYAGRWMLMVSTPGVSAGFPVKGAELMTLRVADSGTPQTMTLDCPVALIEAAAREIPQPEKR